MIANNITMISTGSALSDPSMREYSDPVQTQALLARIVQVGGARLGRFERWSTLAARGPKRIARLFHLRECAMQFEAEGKQVTADFYWTEARQELSWIVQHYENWQYFLENLPAFNDARESTDPDSLFRGIVREAFVDTHLVWYETWRSKQNPRADRHLAYVRWLVDFAGLSDEEKQSRIGPRTVNEIRDLQERKDWSKARRLAIELVRAFPDVTAYVNGLCEVCVNAALASLDRRDRPSSRRLAERRLAVAIYELKKLRVDRPHHLAIFDAIARLQLARAEILEKNNSLAEALAEVESALTYSPNLNAGIQLRSRFEGEMQQLRVRAADPDQSFGRGREANTLRRQAVKGFRLVDAFRRSDEVRSVTDNLLVARGRVLWESIGLGPLETIDHRPLALDDAIQTILHDPPAQADQLPTFWKRVSQDNPYLRERDSKRVIEFIALRLFGADFTAAPSDVKPSDVALLDLLADAPVRSSELFFPWLFSRRNRWLKIRVAAAVLLAVMATVNGVAEFTARNARTLAYESLKQARNELNYESMLDAARKFSGATLNRKRRSDFGSGSSVQ